MLKNFLARATWLTKCIKCAIKGHVPWGGVCLRCGYTERKPELPVPIVSNKFVPRDTVYFVKDGTIKGVAKNVKCD